MQPDQAPDTSQASSPPLSPRTPRAGTKTPRTLASATRTYQSPHESAARTYQSPHGSATRTYRSPPGSAVRRSPRFSPYSTPTQQPPSIPRHMTSPQPVSSTESRPPRSPAPPRPFQSPEMTERPRNDIWQHYMIERENGKKHGRCKYCGILKKNGKPNGNLLKHLTKPQQCPAVPHEVQMSLRSPSIPKFTSASAKIAPSPSDELNQDAFEMALARVFLCVCASIYACGGSDIPRLYRHGGSYNEVAVEAQTQWNSTGTRAR
ncbi:unnamed protein product [Phytophthora fragariaefolia]|uniref:Unnamed protein product n=1 Tax=Phytophthora fragariaefolia TaxID=1490495 RepID=A0A9W6XQV7_9STRA|nr:unnamed protein product [Phytophthora fragariaefolia]